MLSNITSWLVECVADWGYAGIFALMALESSFFPFPSEVVMIPAGYLVQQGEMDAFAAWGAGLGGSLAGAIFNYFLCYFYGRRLILRYGKLLGINRHKWRKFERFFNKYGEISTFNSRLIPGIRQYISLPAGLARMHFGKFCFYTGLGAGIWCVLLMALGYVLSDNQELIKEYLHVITIALLGFVLVVSVVYLRVKGIKLKNLWRKA